MIKKNKIIYRKCIFTNEILPINELIRIVKLKNNEILIDSQAQGRGAYIKKEIKLIKQVTKKKILNKAFKMNVNNLIYQKLEKKLQEIQNDKKN